MKILKIFFFIVFLLPSTLMANGHKLEEQNLNVLNFHRYELGEGIEVNKIDFAEEVKSQLEN